MRMSFVAAAVLAGLSSAQAADMPLKAPMAPAPSNWTAVYLGGFAGGTWAHVHYSDPAAGAVGSVNASGFIGGVYGGFDYELPNRFVVGAKVTVPLTSAKANTTVFSFGPAAPSSGKAQWATTVNITGGYDMGWWMPYAGVGIAYLSNKVTLGGTAGPESDTQLHTGLNVMVGGKFKIAQNWAAGVQYSHTDFSGQTYTFPRNFDSGVVKLSADSLVGTLEYRY